MRPIAGGVNFGTYQLGTLKVTSLRDGYVDMPPSRLRQLGDTTFGDQLPTTVDLVEGVLRLSVNAFAIQSDTEITLIDTGASNAWHPSMGLLAVAFEEAGLSADDVDTVALTHTHIDHVNGLVLPDGSFAFPNLRRLLVPEAELDLFKTETRLQYFHSLATPFKDGEKINANIVAISTPGHEVGHTCFLLESEGEHLLIWGDIVHVPSIQFEQPEIAWEFDADQDGARESRLRMMALAAERSWPVAGAHLDFPGIGRVNKSGDAYIFEAF